MNLRALIIVGLLLAPIPGVVAQVSSPIQLTSGWGSKGDHEPSTALDATGEYMFRDPDQSAAGHQVYFNAFNTQPIGYIVSTEFSIGANFASLGTAHQGYPYIAHALLGIWKDCNKDGYMGMADNALFEYRAELLTDTSVCPPATVPPINIPANYLFPHNDRTWIHEFLPIGWETQNMSGLDPNPMNLNDTGARVWADAGLPGSHAGGTCFLRPEPRGTFHNVAGMITWLDCYGSGRIDMFRSIVTDTTGTGSEWSTVSTLKPWGEQEDQSYAEAWDCSQDPLLSLYDIPTPQVAGNTKTVNVTNVSAPRAPPSVSTDGSAAGTMNSTMNGLDQCHRTHADGAGGSGAGWALFPYELGCNVAPPCEADISNQPSDRFTTDQTLFFGQGSAPRAAAQIAVGKWASSDAGTYANDFTGVWSGNSITALSRNPFVDRDSLSIQGVSYVSYYAFVSPGAKSMYGLTLPNGGATGLYGSEACGAATIGVVNGWNCDASQWWRDSFGTDTAPKVGRISGAPNVDVAARVGSPYNLRDIDCTDESIAALRDVGVSYGTVTGTQCN